MQWERPALDNTDMDISITPPHPGHETKEESLNSPIVPPSAPPSGCDEPPPLPPVRIQWCKISVAYIYRALAALIKPLAREFQQEPPIKEIGDELMSFYNDIAELEKGTTAEPQENPPEKETKPPKKKSKVRSSMGLKHKSVSNLVAKWQQVAEEINSD